uniref:DUF155 domain-containing protein n=1 Tax=Ditylenchus dipsaci TaxID=166011 RepID=A0A915E0B9_9BILA
MESDKQQATSSITSAPKGISFTSKKLTRRKRPLTASYKSALDESGLIVKGIALFDDVVDTTIHLTPRLMPDVCKDNISELFVFSDGVVVYWNITPQEQDSISSCLEEYQTDPHTQLLSEEEAEKMPFKIVEKGKSTIKQDTILLSTEHIEFIEKEQARSIAILERYAFSHAIAKSTKISMWERELNEQAEPLFAINRGMIDGKIICSHKEVVQNIGRFASLKHSIYLTELLSEDFYWERPDLEKHYAHACRYFITQNRLYQMDKRLDYCGETLERINELLSHRHSSRLEWLIIWLIVIEVFFDFFHYFDHNSAKPVYIVQQPKESE